MNVSIALLDYSVEWILEKLLGVDKKREGT
jgi:hypothetical protein